MRRRTGAVVLAAALLTGCGGGEPAARPAAQASPSPTADPAAAAAIEAADDFLAAVIAEQYAVAYEALSEQARSGTSEAEFAAARAAKAGSARSLGRRYALSGATGTPPVLTVTGEGFLADGTEAALSLPVRLVGGVWRVDAVPTAF